MYAIFVCVQIQEYFSSIYLLEWKKDAQSFKSMPNCPSKGFINRFLLKIYECLFTYIFSNTE